MADIRPMSESLYLIMLALREPRHGYGVLVYVRTLTGGKHILFPGTIYNTLSRLVREGLVDCFSDSGRKEYRLSINGIKVLNTEIDRLSELREYSLK